MGLSIVIFVIVVFNLVCTYGDLPLHCLNVEIAGKWKFELSSKDPSFVSCGFHAPDHNADHFQPSLYQFTPTSSFEVELLEPNLVVDNKGEKIGVWTMVYDEGFEVRLEKEQESYFAFNQYEPKSKNLQTSAVSDYISHCDQTMVGWFHETNGAYWGCWKGTRISSDSSLQLSQNTLKLKNSNVVSPRVMIQKTFYSSVDFVNSVNNDPDSKWKATVYEMFEGLSYTELIKKSGGPNFIRRKSPVPRSLIDLSNDPKKYEGLPENWDWRNINGVNFDSHVRNQGGCGSCYAHASISALEGRFRVASQNKFQPFFSVQNVLDCSIWNQACEGGYPFLVSRHAQAFGLVDEKCEEYTGQDADCEVSRFLQGHPQKQQKQQQQQQQQKPALLEGTIDVSQCVKRYYIKDYHYVGGYYGGCNEVAMMKEIYENGPITVAFQSPSELFAYKSGVFDKTNDEMQTEDEHVAGLNLWQQTNHAVVAVGWGKLDDGTKYWILKNTWGESWGEKGYFRILRGVDFCAVESMAVASTVILPEGV